MGQSRRELLVATLAVLGANTGCSGLLRDHPGSDERLTPVPVPDPTPTAQSTAASENGRAIAMARDERGHWAGIEAIASAEDEASAPTPDSRAGCGRSPGHVVERQVRALRSRGVPTDTDIQTAWQLMAPSYRRSLGSPERFEAVVRTTYQPLVEAETVTFSPVSRTGETAIRQVTASGVDTSTEYVWRLERQGGGAFEGCWLTTAIDPV